jgi:hypothetical protein
VAVLPKSAKLAESQVSDNFQLLVSESGLTETFARKSYHWQRRCVSWPATIAAPSAPALLTHPTRFERVTVAFWALLLALPTLAGALPTPSAKGDIVPTGWTCAEKLLTLG